MVEQDIIPTNKPNHTSRSIHKRPIHKTVITTITYVRTLKRETTHKRTPMVVHLGKYTTTYISNIIITNTNTKGVTNE